MSQLDWQLWDRLRGDLERGVTSWGRNQILEHMNKLEREMMRTSEKVNAEG